MGEQYGLTKSIEQTLRAVIDTLIDGERGFGLIGQDLRDESLKTLFFAEAQTRQEFRRMLEKALHQIGVADASESGTIVGTIHRSWGDLKAKMGGSDRELIQTACQGEQTAVHSYKVALEQQLLLPIRQVLLNQQAHVVEILEYLEEATESRD